MRGRICSGVHGALRRCCRPAAGWLFAFLCLPACGGGGETIVAIAPHPVDPDIVYVVTHNGVLKTRDGGTSWQRVFTGATQSRVQAIGLDPSAPSTIYVGTKDDGVYKSYDGGQHWMSRRAGLDDVRVTAEVQQFLFGPGTQPRVFRATAMGVFESDDGGEVWRKRMAGITGVLMVTTMAMDPVSPEILYAGTSSGVYKTTDEARSWVAVNRGLIPAERVQSSRSLGITALAVNPQQTETLYAGTLDGLYKTVDGGRSWSRIGKNLPDQFVSAITFDHARPDVLYIGGGSGVFASRDGGVTWELRDRGLESHNVLALVASRAKPGLLFARTNGSGLYRSRDDAAMWEHVTLGIR